jgi:nitrate reductase NapE component
MSAWMYAVVYGVGFAVAAGIISACYDNAQDAGKKPDSFVYFLAIFLWPIFAVAAPGYMAVRKLSESKQKAAS